MRDLLRELHAFTTAGDPVGRGVVTSVWGSAPRPEGACLLATRGAGTNNVDLEACRARGIVVSNIRGYAEHTVPEHVMALMLALSRNLIAWRETVQAGRWQ